MRFALESLDFDCISEHKVAVGFIWQKGSAVFRWGDRSEIKLMPNTAVPFLAFSAALKLSISFRDP